MQMVTSTSIAYLPPLPPAGKKVKKGKCVAERQLSEPLWCRILARSQLYAKIGQIMTAKLRMKNTRCYAGQTQTLTRENRTSTRVPGKDKPPELDRNDGGWPPLNGGGGGGGGGGGDSTSGGWFLFGFLGFLDVLKEEETRWLSKSDRRESNWKIS